MKISKEEIFGPFMSVFKFSSTDEVIKRANSNKFGLAAGILLFLKIFMFNFFFLIE